MEPKELIRAGKLSEAREVLTQRVKTSPGDIAARTLLFQTLAFLGEWDRAERHLDALASQSPSAEIGVQTYKNLIGAERERMEVFEMKRRPSALPGLPPYFEKMFVFWEKLLSGAVDEAKSAYDEVDALRPMALGTLDGEKFTGFADTDAFLSPFLEAAVHERYVWFPFDSIRELTISAPKTLLDLIWVPARVTTREGLSVGCFLFVLYPGSFSHEDDRLKMGRMTEWVHLGDDFHKGVGLHVYRIGKEETTLLEIREVSFRTPKPGTRK